MNEPNQTTSPPAPAADSTVAAQPPAPIVARPEGLPEAFWDTGANAINGEALIKHFSEIAERDKTIPEKPEGYELKVQLPEDVKVPDGVQLKIDDKDPRIPLLRTMAHKHRLPPQIVNDIVAIDAQMKIAAHNAENERVAGEVKKLGAKAQERIAAVGNWVKGLSDKGDLTKDEAASVAEIATSAAGVSLLEKLIAKSNGTVPGLTITPVAPPAAPQPKSLAERMYPNLPSESYERRTA